jgi:hypothetical protein
LARFQGFAMTPIMNVGIDAGSEFILSPRFDGRQFRPLVDPLLHQLRRAPFLATFARAWLKVMASPRPRRPSPATPNGGAARRIDRRDETIVEICDPCNLSGALREDGELCVRGRQVMAGQRRRQADAAEAMFEGRLRTVDIGCFDETGYSYLVYRIKDLILCSGFNVCPRVIEETLCGILRRKRPSRSGSPTIIAATRRGPSSGAGGLDCDAQRVQGVSRRRNAARSLARDVGRPSFQAGAGGSGGRSRCAASRAATWDCDAARRRPFLWVRHGRRRRRGFPKCFRGRQG